MATGVATGCWATTGVTVGNWDAAGEWELGLAEYPLELPMLARWLQQQP